MAFNDRLWILARVYQLTMEEEVKRGRPVDHTGEDQRLDLVERAKRDLERRKEELRRQGRTDV